MVQFIDIASHADMNDKPANVENPIKILNTSSSLCDTYSGSRLVNS